MKKIALFLLIIPIFASAQQKKLVDKVVAKVDGEVILKSDLDQAFAFYRMQFPANISDSELRKKILDELITEKLLYVEAKKDTTIKVTDAEIDKYLDQQIQNMKQQMGEKAFQEKLKEEGLTEAALRRKYRKNVREQLYVQKLIEKKIKPLVSVSPDEVKKFYETHLDSIPPKPDMVRIAHILIRIKPSPEVVAQAKRKAEALYKKLQNGASFEDLASKYSDDLQSAANGGDIGIVKKTDLPEHIRKVVAPLEPGEIAPPVEGDYGFHIFKMVEKQDDMYHLKQIFVQFRPTRNDTLRAKKLAEKVYRLLKSGKYSFDELASKYSDDTDTKDLGGDLGWIPVTNLPPDMKSVIDTMKVGEISAPVLTQFGYHIIKLIDRKKGGRPSFEEIQPQLTQILYQRKLQQAIDAYVKKLRKKIYVKIYES